eukprot:UN22818
MLLILDHKCIIENPNIWNIDKDRNCNNVLQGGLLFHLYTFSNTVL